MREAFAFCARAIDGGDFFGCKCAIVDGHFINDAKKTIIRSVRPVTNPQTARKREGWIIKCETCQCAIHIKSELAGTHGHGEMMKICILNEAGAWGGWT